MEAVAKLQNCPMSARKMRLVVDNIRGLDANKALNDLKFTKKEAAVWLEKLVLSAVNNWEQKNPGANPEDHGLFIKSAIANEGGMLKRFRPAPHGRAHRIRKRRSHVTLVIDSKVPVSENVEVDSTEEEA